MKGKGRRERKKAFCGQETLNHLSIELLFHYLVKTWSREREREREREDRSEGAGFKRAKERESEGQWGKSNPCPKDRRKKTERTEEPKGVVGVKDRREEKERRTFLVKAS